MVAITPSIHISSSWTILWATLRSCRRRLCFANSLQPSLTFVKTGWISNSEHICITIYLFLQLYIKQSRRHKNLCCNWLRDTCDAYFFVITKFSRLEFLSYRSSNSWTRCILCIFVLLCPFPTGLVVTIYLMIAILL